MGCFSIWSISTCEINYNLKTGQRGMDDSSMLVMFQSTKLKQKSLFLPSVCTLDGYKIRVFLDSVSFSDGLQTFER